MNDLLAVLLKAKQLRNAGLLLSPGHDAKPVADALTKDRYLRSERVLDSGENPAEADKILSRYYITGKGAKRLGCHGSAVNDVLLRGGSAPVGFDRANRQVEHRDGVFLSKSPEIARYFATRFSKDTSIIQECMVALHSMVTINGEGKTSKELKLNSLRHTHINQADGVKVVNMHMGHLDAHNVRYLTEEHIAHGVPELATIYIVFRAHDVYPLDDRPVADIQQMANEAELATCGEYTSDINTLTVPKFK